MSTKLCSSCKESAVETDSPIDSPDWEPSDNERDGIGTPTQDDDADDNEPTQVESDSGGGCGTPSKSKEEIAKEIQDAIQNALDDIRNSEEVKKGLEQTHSQLKNFKGKTLYLKKAEWYHATPSKLRGIKNSIVSEFSRLRENCDPGWRNRVDSGRLNIQRYISTDEPDTAFDVWNDGNSDAVDIEAVICVDVSPSMNARIEETLEGMWVLKSALDTINANCTVISWSWGAEILYSPDEKASSAYYRKTRTFGGTNPEDAIHQTAAILHDSNRSKKILITITDGEYSNDDLDQFVVSLSASGVHTAFLYMPHASGGVLTDAHGHAISATVTEPKSIVQFVRELVTNIIKNDL